jgi:hypothetical protein
LLDARSASPRWERLTRLALGAGGRAARHGKVRSFRGDHRYPPVADGGRRERHDLLAVNGGICQKADVRELIWGVPG